MAPYLPFELWALSCEYLDKPSLKNLRASSRQFLRFTSPALFRTVHFNLDHGGIDRLVTISEHKVLRKFVRTLVLRRDYGLYRFSGGFESWENSVAHELDQSNSRNDNRSSGDFKHPTGTTTDECDPMSREEWRGMDKDARRRLYEEYEKDRIALQEDTLNLARGIQFQPLGLLLKETFGIDRAAWGDSEPSLSDRLDWAISRFPNLEKLSHEPSYLIDENWGLHWRRVSFNRDKLLSNTSDKEEERLESLQISLVLRALGLRKSQRRTLVHLELHVAGSAFWGTTNLGRLWNLKRTQQMRGNSPILTIEDIDLDTEIDDRLELPNGNYSALSHKEHLTRELVIMEHSFIQLTEIQLEINCCQHDGNPSVVAHQLYYFLRQSERLTKLSLIFKAEDFNHEEPNFAYPAYGEQHSEATSRLLRCLALNNCWPCIQELRLSINVGGEDLIHFLLGASQTLRHLKLESVALAPGSKTWEEIFEYLSKGLKLESFKFRCLEDNGIPGGRVIGEPTTPDWKSFESGFSCYCHYEDAICRYVLGRSFEKPLVEPVQFLQHHIQACHRAIMATSNAQALFKEKQLRARSMV